MIGHIIGSSLEDVPHEGAKTFLVICFELVQLISEAQQRQTSYTPTCGGYEFVMVKFNCEYSIFV